ncbi:MAG: flagellar hook assembly protein FlgD [Desulfobulbaceae bacterium]|nr:flagellar hook assembly protein FlgD [Desulfobulbaceae bacterium]
MNAINDISQLTANKSSTTTESKATLLQKDFLTLLIAQLQNQDPLNPSDPTEFTAQLAQFSQLEQLLTLNSNMESLADAQNSSQRLSALSLIGKEVLVEGSSFELTTGPIQLGYRVEGAASDVTLHIQDKNGKNVATLIGDGLENGNHFITWDGLDANGDPLPPGSYDIVIEAQSALEEGSVGVIPLVRSEVNGVDLTDSGIMLLTKSGSYQFADVHGVYDSADTTSATNATQTSNISTLTEGAIDYFTN